MIAVRELVPGDAGQFRALRLEALRLHPDAFGSLYEVEAAGPVADFAARIAKGGLFGGFVDGRLVGMAGFFIDGSAQSRHKGTLWGMYVREGARGKGLSAAIVNAVVEHAAERVEQILLAVAAPNHRAIRFYERMGFKSFATEPRALKIGGRYVDELLMIRFLERGEESP